MKKTLTLVLALMACTLMMAQKAVITFASESHDFGEIQEANGPVTYEFKYTNTGKTPLVLHNVQASCGCTTPEWTRTPIQPGKEGSIKVTFNPQNRPGSFSKTITIQSNADTPTKTIRILGNVLQKPKTMEDEYPIKMENLRLSDTHLAFTKLAPEEVKIAEVKVWNNSAQDLTPEFINVPSHIQIASIPATIKVGETGVIQANYDAAKKNDWGFVTDQVYVIFDGQRAYKNRLTISATIAEDFSKLSDAELSNAPSVSFDSKDFDFGSVGQGSKVEHDYIITNNGEKNLVIRKVKASCGCTAVNPAKTILAKGESTTIHATFDSRGKSGRQQKTITVITNDPKQSNVILRISGTVTVPTQQ
ncbi:MAG: DUF1573 domain-containing protein [Bacteroidales bacterium]|nr:DUF1573 domain-containing protein [Bacteroidales bacterium]